MPDDIAPHLSDFAAKGRIWLRGALRTSDVSDLLDRVDGAGMSRLPAEHPLMASNASWVAPIQVLWPDMRPVRGVLFDKSDGENWAVPWHQDRVIAVRQRRDVPGFTAWSQKAGIWHCAPPTDVLARMLFVRVHLDDCSAQTGAMEIACGSHRAGVVQTADAAAVAARYPIETTDAQAGDILVLHMLTLHRSSPSQTSRSRRVLRFDLADQDLPFGLEYAV